MVCASIIPSRLQPDVLIPEFSWGHSNHTAKGLAENGSGREPDFFPDIFHIEISVIQKHLCPFNSCDLDIVTYGAAGFLFE